jgi:hypothetical protein
MLGALEAEANSGARTRLPRAVGQHPATFVVRMVIFSPRRAGS